MNKELQLFAGIYRGTVVDNKGSKGLCKVFVTGIYQDSFKNDSNALPWAEPAMFLFGGNFNNSRTTDLNSQSTINTIPHIGSEVFVFFENGDHLHPIFFASSCGGNGWKSEHENQHIIQTDNVKITIDENPTDNRSSSKFDSFNANCTESSVQKRAIETTLNIECQGNVRIKVFGSVNMQINGDLYREINGNVSETINGNYYRSIRGNIEEDHFGNKRIYQAGNSKDIQGGNAEISKFGTVSEFYNGNKTVTSEGNLSKNRIGNETKYIVGNLSTTINSGNETKYITAGFYREMIFGQRSSKVCGNSITESVGNMKFISPKIDLN